jgi:hypothetical protein
MSALELFQLATSSGVLAGGFGLLKWAFATERRLAVLEARTENPHWRKP